jgi:hypothetical protein
MFIGMELLPGDGRLRSYHPDRCERGELLAGERVDKDRLAARADKAESDVSIHGGLESRLPAVITLHVLKSSSSQE